MKNWAAGRKRLRRTALGTALLAVLSGVWLGCARESAERETPSAQEVAPSAKVDAKPQFEAAGATLLKVCADPETGAESVALREADGRVVIRAVASLTESGRQFVADFQNGKIDNRGRILAANGSPTFGGAGFKSLQSGVATGKIAGRPEKYAILIGVDKYDDRLVPSLRFCGRDMELLAETLVAGGFPEENVVLLTTAEGLSPTKAEIESTLSAVLGILEPQDAVVVAFSGHGVMFDADGSGARSYFCPQDLSVKSFEGLTNSLISRHFVDSLLNDCRARQKLLICDACRSEDFKKEDFVDAFAAFGGQKGLNRGGIELGMDAFSGVPSQFYILTSCSPGKKSREDANLAGGHGVFTWFLVEALRGYADVEPSTDGNCDGAVGIQEAFRYANRKMAAYEMYEYRTNENGEMEKKPFYQNPALYGGSDGDHFALTVYEELSSLENDAEAEEEKKRREAEDEAKRQAEEKTKLREAEEEAKRQAEEETKLREAEEEAKRREAEEEAKRQADPAAKRQAEIAERLKKAENFLAADDYEKARFEIRRVFNLDATNAEAKRLLTLIEGAKNKKTQTPRRFMNKVGLVFRLVPEGEFTMGDSLQPNEVAAKFPGGGRLQGFYSDAHPRHNVKISAFYMSVHQTTVADFQKFVDATGYRTLAETKGAAYRFDLQMGEWDDVAGLSWKNPGFERRNDCPATCVAWVDAQKYVDWLNDQENNIIIDGEEYEYALPTEAQWEYACRAGTETNFFWGDEEKDGEGYLNAGDQNSSWRYPFSFNDGYVSVAPVGTFKPNAWGLCDMSGNVWEWCSDWYGADYYSRSENAVDPSGPSNGAARVLRGGSWYCFPESCRSASRNCATLDFVADDFGFRVALVRKGSKRTDAAPTVEVAPVSVAPTVEAAPAPLPPTDSTSERAAFGAFLNDRGMEFRLVPAGSFTMGDALSPADVGRKYAGHANATRDARPRRQVEITQPFYMAKFETTIGDFRRFVDATGHKTTAEQEGNAFGEKPNGEWDNIDGLSWRYPGTLNRDDRHPVTCVSWTDAQKYVEWLNNEAGPDGVEIDGKRYKYALPTEAQWEYACRAGSETTFFWGENFADGKEYVNVGNWSGNARNDFLMPPDGYLGTAPVGSFKPNAWGLCDMIGNVWEWCSDWYGADYYKKSPKKDPKGPATGSLRVDRGGAWNSGADSCRSADRGVNLPSVRTTHLGFRVALVPEPASHRAFAISFQNALGMDFLVVPAGEFTMGDATTKEEVLKNFPVVNDYHIDARPRRKVKISRLFYMCANETTVGDFKKFVDETGYKTTAEKEGWATGLTENGVWGRVDGLNWQTSRTTAWNDRHPVVCVSWDDARKFVEWLNRKAGPDGVVIDGKRYEYALPTEAQWEYACRAGSDSTFFWGERENAEGFLNASDLAANSFWRKETLDYFRFNDGYSRTAPVGSFKPNGFGLNDMSGNVWEWCADWLGAYSSGDATDPKGPSSGDERVYRGGSWNSVPAHCRCANRDGDPPSARFDSVGFRVALVPKSPR